MPSVPALCRLVGVHESVGRRWSASKRIVSIGPAASTRGFEALALRTLRQFPTTAMLAGQARSYFVKELEHLMAKVPKWHELLCKTDNVGDVLKLVHFS